MTVLAKWMLFSSAKSSLDLGPGMEVFTLGPEGSPRITVLKHLTPCWCLNKRPVDFTDAAARLNLLSAMVGMENKLFVYGAALKISSKWKSLMKETR